MTARATNSRRRGEPLVVLGAIALGWITIRAFAWQPPFPLDRETRRTGVADIGAVVETYSQPGFPQGRSAHIADLPLPQSTYLPMSVGRLAPLGAPIALPALPELPHAQVSHALLSSVGASVPSEPAPRGPSLQAPEAAAAMPKRWHIDSWIAWRPSGVLQSVAPGRPLVLSYGASQAGTLARLDLAASPRRPQLYARALHAPDSPSQSDLAVGLSARPLAAIPVRLQAEARATRSQGETVVRPAVLAVTELAPLRLPFSLRAEGYAQGGWVGGRYATGFVDGQARIDREMIALGPAKVRLGAGAWGGAQKSAGRLDVGPTLSLDLRDSSIPARLSLDYRHQVAGNARPGSGVAVTLSTGF